MTITRMIERDDLLAFANACKITDYTFGDKPDLIFTDNHRNIGIEHCRIYVSDAKLVSGRQLLPQEKIHWAILDQARDIFKQKLALHLWVITTFHMGFSDYKKEDIAATAELLATTVLEDIKVNTPVTPRERRQINVGALKYGGLPYPKGIFSVSYSIEEDPRMEAWGPSYGYGVPELTPEAVQASIDGKNQKITGYRPCDEMWLLMVTDAGMPSSHFRVSDALMNNRYATKFDRLFLFKRAEVKILELPTLH